MLQFIATAQKRETMPYFFFIWSEEIVEHLAQHDVTPDQFEEVVRMPIAANRAGLRTT